MKKIVLGTTLVLVGIALYTSLALAAETSPLANAIAKQLETAPQSIDMQAAIWGFPAGRRPTCCWPSAGPCGWAGSSPR